MAIGFNKNQKSTTASKANLGTFAGVFTPSILTILGVIMYLRMGWVVGNVGLFKTLLIVTLSTSITFLTALSIAAIATNKFVRTGGAYFMISRALGIEVGGAIGIPLFFAQTFSVALYTIGFAESFSNTFPQFNMTEVGLIVTILVAALALISTKIAVKSQYFILAAIAISILSLIFGSPVDEPELQTYAAKVHEPFWKVFAVFFPAVTGIMVGVNMSGDLKNPAKSIPKGTFYAIGTGYLIYMLLPLLLAYRADPSTLTEDPLIMRKMAFWGDAILLGVWGASLSSALGSILGAPRVLQAMVQDNIFPSWMKWLAKSSRKGNVPRNGTLLTLVLVLIAVYFGNLNIIAPILTMFFLATYAMLNISAGLEKLLDSPSFRPAFKVHWFFSFLGAAGCIAVMFLINPSATVIAIAVLVIIFLLLEKQKISAGWGDLRQGIFLTVIRFFLLRLKRSDDPKNWRPHILVLSGAPTKRWHLIALANSFVQSRGLMTVATILKEKRVTSKHRISMEENINRHLRIRGIKCLVRVIYSDDIYYGALRLADSYGLGSLVPNTVMLGSTERPENKEAFGNMIRFFHESRKNVIVVRSDEEKIFGQQKRIDIWLRGIRYNGALMIILAYLLQNSHDWHAAEVNLRMIVRDKESIKEVEQNLAHITHNFRIAMKINVLLADNRPFEEIARKESAGADMIFLGLAEPGKDFLDYYVGLTEKLTDFPTTVFILASQELRFDDVLA